MTTRCFSGIAGAVALLRGRSRVTVGSRIPADEIGKPVSSVPLEDASLIALPTLKSASSVSVAIGGEGYIPACSRKKVKALRTFSALR